MLMMDNFQSPLQIISQQESHQSHQVTSFHDQNHLHHNHFHNPHHQQVYLIEFQPQQTAPNSTLSHHLSHNQHQTFNHHHHHHQPQQHQPHDSLSTLTQLQPQQQQQQQQQQTQSHLHQQPQQPQNQHQQTQQAQQQNHQQQAHHHQQQQQHTHQLHPQQHHDLQQISQISLINGTSQSQQHHLMSNGQTLINSNGTHFAHQCQTGPISVSNAAGELAQSTDSGSLLIQADTTQSVAISTSNGLAGMRPTSTTTTTTAGTQLMIDPYNGHHQHAVAPLSFSTSSGSPSDIVVNSNSQHQSQHDGWVNSEADAWSHTNGLHHVTHQQTMVANHQPHLIQVIQQQPTTLQLQPQQTNLTAMVTTNGHHLGHPQHQGHNQQQQQQQQQHHQQVNLSHHHPLQPQQQLQQISHNNQQRAQHLQPQIVGQTTMIIPPTTTITATSTTPNNQPVRRKRKRCGVCPGCEHKDNCGECGPCKSVRSHQICKMRKCDKLKHKRQTTKKQAPK